MCRGWSGDDHARLPQGLVAPKKGDGEWAKWRREFELAGGKIYFNDIGDIDTLRKKIERQVKPGEEPEHGPHRVKAFFDGVETAQRPCRECHPPRRLQECSRGRAEQGQGRLDRAQCHGQLHPARQVRAGDQLAYAFFNAGTQGSAT
jgi:hypothetical protein